MDSNKIISYTTKTLVEAINSLACRCPVDYPPNLDCTLNAAYNIYPAVQPTNGPPKYCYFGIGIGGKYNITDTNLSSVFKPDVRELNLYNQLPFRCIPEDEDTLLTDTERAQYRCRVPITVSGNKYYAYYLKKLIYTGEIYLIYVDPVTQAESLYKLDPSYLHPTGKIPATSGLTEATLGEVTACCVAKATITGAEVTEAINVLYDGDMRYAVLSEIGIFSGEDAVVESLNYQNVKFTYTEAMCMHMAAKNTWNGMDMSNPTATDSRRLLITEGTVMVLADGIAE